MSDDVPVWDIEDLPSEAPTIGSVLPLARRDASPGVAYRATEWFLDAVTSGRLHAAGASLVGLGHHAAGTGRQDCFGVFPVGDGRLCVALADGLGSRPAAQLGARLFVESVGGIVARDDAGSAAELLLAASERVAYLATAGYLLEPEEVGYVALVALVGADGAQVARVGDVSGFRVSGAEFVELFEPSDEFVNLVPATLPATGSEPAVEEVLVAAPDTLALVSDGLAIDIRTSEAVREWLGARWRRPLSAFAMGDTLRYRRRGSHDDRTGVVVWVNPAEATDPPPADPPSADQGLMAVE
jgi:serine/threonine protein phosphatase PrpC